ncbi:hypothetical protein RI129_000681 [Pyrocoelia pectoralis]|uniref:GrpE protein homolog n=1 Tax=Pyrocoelia pectoralis TaxID=417401 RepID=A0AAN7ZR73_9COLE
MALMNARGLIRLGHLVTETITLNARSITLGTLRTTATEQTNPSTDAPPPPDMDSKIKEELAKLNKEVATLNEKSNELMDKYKRSLADGENLRNRLTKQISDAKIYGIQDVLSKATESVPKEEISDKNPHLKNLYEGLMMTEQQLQNVFKRHGLEPVDPINEKFDPNFHEALFQQEVEGKTPGSVVVVSKIGYKLHDRVIRPALVGVSK